MSEALIGAIEITSVLISIKASGLIALLIVGALLLTAQRRLMGVLKKLRRWLQ